jgi:phytoene desaturase
LSKKNIHIIGAGVAGLSAAGTLAKLGYEVEVFDKNPQVGGRASIWKKDGFTFDMGPSWYWMPEVFEEYFESMDSSVAAHYDLIRLDPSYRVFFGEEQIVDVPASFDELKALFESFEPGAARKLQEYMDEASYKYQVGMNEFVWKPSKSILDFMQFKVLRSLLKLDMLTSISDHVSKYFQDTRIKQIMEFPVLFLGAPPSSTPALYSLMNYADLKLGTWYPKKGMHEISKGMHAVAEQYGAKFHLNAPVEEIQLAGNKTKGIRLQGGATYESEAMVAAADYHHVDQHLLPKGYQQYSERYWESRAMAPSSLLFYLGFDRTLPGLKHHNLFFDESFDVHSDTIYNTGTWPKDPMFYACVPSKTDPTVAPEGMENVFLLVPLAPGLKDDEKERDRLFEFMMKKLEHYTGVDPIPHVKVKRAFAMNEFQSVYNSFKGNAYGLANTLRQTAFLKPSMFHKKLKNLFFAGQLTVPGPGLPPSIISGQLAARQVHKKLR